MASSQLAADHNQSNLPAMVVAWHLKIRAECRWIKTFKDKCFNQLDRLLDK